MRGRTDAAVSERGRLIDARVALAVAALVAACAFAAGYALSGRGGGDGASGTDNTLNGRPGAGTPTLPPASTSAPSGAAAAPSMNPAPTDAAGATVLPAEPTASSTPQRPPPTSTLPTPWVGVNNWALAASSDVHSDCGGASELLLDGKLSQLQAAGVDVVRFAAYQSFSIDANHQRNWAAFDRVFAAAQRHGIHLIPILGNNWTDCDYWGAFPGAAGKDAGTPLACGGAGNWYDIGYKQPYNGYLTGYRQWVADFVGRYSRHPMLVAWELINEPWESCIHDFFVDVIGVVRAADPVTPISLGSAGGGEAWSRGEGYRRETALADWATAHTYGDPDDPLPVTPGCPNQNCLRSDIADAGALDKPFYVGEAGISESTECDSERRAQQYRAKMRAAFDAGASGYILWAYNQRAPLGMCGLDFGPQSPIMRVFGEF